ncbi:proton-conducting transporter transmembrane domain-containing protein [Sabulicella rubraurantiaca]|uniref:proton-conducting transporter transmembrane domain-containing protein n=1 Tax=Sabulicella rubraurantiaca TaxID=2811429 RepID=UPI001A95E877|nr:proton-conducting transporter membrane subunit [Sabulicella rubraurantiaca]
MVGMGMGAALASAALAALGLLTAAWVLAVGGFGPVALPFGPPWGAMSLALDPLSGWFLLVLGAAGLPAALFAAASGLSRAQALLLPPFLLSMALVLLAADTVTLLLGFEAMSLLSWGIIAAGGHRRAARLYLGFATVSGVALLGMVAALAPSGFGFDAIRAAPPEGLRATLLLGLVLLGAGSKAGLVPLHPWLPVAHPAAPTALSALMSAAMVKIALYVLLRVTVDLAGPAQPAWWGVPFLVLGAVTALWGAIRANLEADMKAVLACSTLENVGLLAIALGLCLMFRGSDLRPLAALALSALLLHALVHACFKTLLFLGAGAVATLAGTRDPDRLGGLIHRMPWVAGLMGIAAASAAALPPFAGFSSEWLLLQSLLQSWRLAEMSFQLLGAAALAAAGMAAALAAAAMLRLAGTVFLGRPRTPRAAGAGEATGLMRLALLLPGGFLVLLSVLAGPALLLAGGAVRQLLGPVAQPPASGLTLLLPDGAALLSPVAVILVLALLLGLGFLAMRHLSPEAPATGPAWDCGFGPAPAHLPFGDVLTQPSAAGAAQPLRRMLGGVPMAVAERHDAATPGSPAPARLRLAMRDRAFPALIGPLTRLRRTLAREAERLRDLPLRGFVALSLLTLVALLALLAVLERLP